MRAHMPTDCRADQRRRSRRRVQRSRADLATHADRPRLPRSASTATAQRATAAQNESRDSSALERSQWPMDGSPTDGEPSSAARLQWAAQRKPCLVVVGECIREVAAQLAVQRLGVPYAQTNTLKTPDGCVTTDSAGAGRASAKSWEAQWTRAMGDGRKRPWARVRAAGRGQSGGQATHGTARDATPGPSPRKP